MQSNDLCISLAHKYVALSILIFLDILMLLVAGDYILQSLPYRAMFFWTFLLPDKVFHSTT